MWWFYSLQPLFNLCAVSGSRDKSCNPDANDIDQFGDDVFCRQIVNGPECELNPIPRHRSVTFPFLISIRMGAFVASYDSLQIDALTKSVDPSRKVP